jgi:hypothetical protein
MRLSLITGKSPLLQASAPNPGAPPNLDQLGSVLNWTALVRFSSGGSNRNSAFFRRSR